jgi:hypothetical protein
MKPASSATCSIFFLSGSEMVEAQPGSLQHTPTEPDAVSMGTHEEPDGQSGVP